MEPPNLERAPHYENTELGNSRRLVDAHGEDLHWAPQLGEWFYWDGRRWSEDLLGEVARRAKQVADELLEEALRTQSDALRRHALRTQSSAGITNMVRLASTEAGVGVRISELDADPFLLCAQNGTIDLRTGDLLNHERHHLITKMTAVAYDPAARCPTWDRFLLDVFDGDRDVIDFVARFAGYSLTGDVSEQVMVFAYGSGRNGKTTLLNTLRAVTGDYGIQIDPAVLVNDTGDQHPTGLTDLRGARFVATAESEHGKRLNEGLVKQLTGGDAVRARRMRQDFFEFEPTHKLWFAGNHLPRIHGTDIGIWRRLALLPFKVEFGPGKADKQLPQKLAAEAPGILAWAVQGCLAWARDGLRIPGAVSAATASYRDSQDHLGHFIDECCVLGEGYCVSSSDLRGAYEKWCSDQGERPWSAKAIGNELSSRGYESMTLGSGYSRKRGWLGVALVATDEARRVPNRSTEDAGELF